MTEYISLIGTVAVINLLGAISPGPDFLITVRNTLRYSRRIGIFTGLGVACGLLVHVSYCAAGVGLIIAHSKILFTLLKLIGGGYLIWLGSSSLLSKGADIQVANQVKKETTYSPWKAFTMGFLTNILNPKALLFFLSLFTFVLNPMPPLWVILTCAAIVFLTAVVWFSSVAAFLTEKHTQILFLRFERTINIVLGLFLCYLGVRILFMLIS
jgi:RhtB (resistance to homoserine/threonine) family protein